MTRTNISWASSLGLPRRTAMRLLLLGVLALAACTETKPRVAIDYDKSTQFASFHSFTVLVRPHPSMNSSPLVEQRTYDAIRQGLSAKGFRFVSDLDEADLAVDFSVGAQDRLDVQSYPSNFAGPWGAGPWGWGNQVDVRQYQEGTLAIDMFDVRSRKAVWHGSAKKELSLSELEHSEEPVRKAVNDVLAGFPPA